MYRKAVPDDFSSGLGEEEKLTVEIMKVLKKAF